MHSTGREFKTEKKITEKVLFVYDEDDFLEKVLTEDIYYIETIKSTHYCSVYHKNGRGRIRADIIRLQAILGDAFLKVRASTLINLKYVSKLDKKNRIIYLAGSNQIWCTYAAQSYKELKQRLHIKCYR